MINLIRNEYLGLPNEYLIIVWDEIQQGWYSVPLTLNILYNVLVNTPINSGQLLAYDASSFIWRNYEAYELSDIVDNLGDHIAQQELDMDNNRIVNVGDPIDNNDAINMNLLDNHDHIILDVNGLQVWINDVLNDLANQTLDDHADVDIGIGPYNDQAFIISSGGQFVILERDDFSVIHLNTASSPINMNNYNIKYLVDGVLTNDIVTVNQLNILIDNVNNALSGQLLGDHSGVVISSLNNFHIIKYNTGMWQNELLDITIDDDDLGNHIAEKDLDMTNNYFVINLAPSGDQPSDVVNAINKGQLDDMETNFYNSLNGQLFDDHIDVDLTGLADGNFMQYNQSTNKWEPATIDTGVADDDLGDHKARQNLDMAFKQIKLLANGIWNFDLINYDQLITLENSILSQSIGTHDDVQLNVLNLADGQFLVHNGTEWTNEEVDLSGDNLGDHIATQNLVMSPNGGINKYKVTNIKTMTAVSDDSDLVPKHYFDEVLGGFQNALEDQTLDQHIDVEYNITLYQDYILYYNSIKQKWNVASKETLKDNLGNHIATEELKMQDFGLNKHSIVNLDEGINNTDAVNKSQFDAHEHVWDDIDKTGSKISDLGDSNYSGLTTGEGLGHNGTIWTNKPLMSVGSIEPTAVPNGYRWMPYGATGGLAAYNGHLLVCKQTGAAYGGFLSTWVNGKGEVVSL